MLGAAAGMDGAEGVGMVPELEVLALVVEPEETEGFTLGTFLGVVDIVLTEGRSTGTAVDLALLTALWPLVLAAPDAEEPAADE